MNPSSRCWTLQPSSKNRHALIAGTTPTVVSRWVLAALSTLLLASTSAAPAWAQAGTPALDSPPTASCRPDGTPDQVNACAYAGYQRAQTQLDERLQAWLRQQPAQRRSALQAEQQAWVLKRDAECRDLAMDAALPQSAAGEYHGCRKQRTLERLASLR